MPGLMTIYGCSEMELNAQVQAKNDSHYDRSVSLYDSTVVESLLERKCKV